MAGHDLAIAVHDAHERLLQLRVGVAAGLEQRAVRRALRPALHSVRAAHLFSSAGFCQLIFARSSAPVFSSRLVCAASRMALKLGRLA
ncbi:hypothetical protein SDC9_202133 [bioreactor metagenome]|uniref:Uncharacterized protein n=1 Tax=bioreactor metagenome TaxID=1076179 RepID=A0A645J4Q7_9ZZZZ